MVGVGLRKRRREDAARCRRVQAVRIVVAGREA
jgi:hypothetical protein